MVGYLGQYVRSEPGDLVVVGIDTQRSGLPAEVESMEGDEKGKAYDMGMPAKSLNGRGASTGDQEGGWGCP